MIEVFEGWLAYSLQANTYKYRRKITRKINQYFLTERNVKINSVKLHENMNNKMLDSNMQFSQQKTLFLLKKGLTIKQIAQRRNIRENTVWDHIARLIEHHQLKLKEIISNNKIKRIIANITSHDDALKQIKTRINDESITYNEISCVLANLKGKHKKKNINYFIQWYKKTNCHRKCYYDKRQREECRIKFQKLATNLLNLEFTKREFLSFFNDNVKICVLPAEEKKRFMSWKEFKKRMKRLPQNPPFS